MPNDPQFPTGYIPYESVALCGNTLRAVGAIFKIGEREPFWVGKAPDKHPRIWLSALSTGGTWIELVRGNALVRSTIYPGAPLAVIQDAREPRTIVLAGSAILVNAIAATNGGSVDVPSIDLRPLGLNIFGDNEKGLSFGGQRFVGNTLSHVGTAFGVNFARVTSDSERQDAYREMKAAGFDPSDFQIAERPDRPTTPAFAITGKAIVTRVSSGDTRTYDAGHGTAWVVELSRDLKAGVYGRPK